MHCGAGESSIMKAFLSLAIALAGFATVHPAYALTDYGLTYTLTGFKTSNANVDNFTLTISGINGPLDTENGRYGVFALAFNEPTGFVSATATTPGFTFVPGGLSSATGSGGCDGHGSSSFCFQTTSLISQHPLAANSTLTFEFSVDATGISTWGDSDFKISWDGNKSKDYNDLNPAEESDFKSGYDHVSEGLPPKPAAAPEIDPASASAALTLLAGGLAVLPRRRRRS